MTKHLIIANWKMNPVHPHDAFLLASKIEAGLGAGKHADVVICPSFPHIAALGGVIKKIKLGAQDVFWEEKGAYTGEVSPSQLSLVGVSHIILGHSERRMYLGETDEMINKKAKAVLGHGMRGVLCVGEERREEGEIPALVAEQITRALKEIKKQHMKNLIICYEPVWAISTNKNARPDTPDNAFRATLFIRKIITNLYDRKTADDMRIIYGGSVRSENIAAFLTDGKMQGALVGGASLDADQFIELISKAAFVAKASKS